MEPRELTQARIFLGDYDKDNRKSNRLKLGLYSLNNVIEGDYDPKYTKIANNILRSYRNKIISEANGLLLEYTTTTLFEVKHLENRILKFIEVGFDHDGELSSLNGKLGEIVCKRECRLTTKELNEIMELLMELDHDDI